MDIGFTVSRYDSDGDKTSDCVEVHIEERAIIKFKDLNELKLFRHTLELIIIEIEETY